MNHPRNDPNGSSATVILPPGVTVQDLYYKQRLKVVVDGVDRKAVVDVIVAKFFGGPTAAFHHFDATGKLYHVKIKIVWEVNGDWNESRDVRLAKVEEFQAWRREFVNGIAPTPMP